MQEPSDREILEFAALRWQRPGAREAAIRERFGLSATQFFQRVNALIDDEAVIRDMPELVLPLRRVREQQFRLKRAG